MAAVPQKVLNWLYSVLTSEYHDVNRTYNDVAQTLSHYSSLSPKTDVYTYENGASALLLHLSGTLPVSFRGTVYRFPIAFWVPYAYPREAPMVYVTPTQTMAVRPGQHVSGEGKVYHPYLAGWGDFWDKSNLLDFLGVLSNVFAKEPPVISKQQQRPKPSAASQPGAAPPPVPPLPPELGRPPTQATPASPTSSLQERPPPPPPKPHENRWSSQIGLPAVSRDVQATLPLSSGRPSGQYESAPAQNLNGSAYQYGTFPSRRSSSLQPVGAPPVPPHPAAMPPQTLSYAQPARPLQPALAPARPAAQPTQDLLSTPSTLSLPSQTATASIPAPPIPPNPEKDALLYALGATLHQHRLAAQERTDSTLPSLEAQHTALQNAMTAMQHELQLLTSLSGSLESNERILVDSMRRADEVMAEAQQRAVPDVDDVLVAPTVVAKQLYEAVADERALEDTMFVLGRALDRGRLGLEGFLKQSRSLAREQFLKKALVKKISRGMGLAEAR
ncbi:MAG: hypothetical protein M1832_002307 [Thelocarpon impressellum]|nr:MAG: hypothetical protein M1832_002307 [Thelocarpon impressellum]